MSRMICPESGCPLTEDGDPRGTWWVCEAMEWGTCDCAGCEAGAAIPATSEQALELVGAL